VITRVALLIVNVAIEDEASITSKIDRESHKHTAEKLTEMGFAVRHKRLKT
jgi:hypothetical protein